MIRTVPPMGDELPESCQGTVLDVWGVLDALLQRHGAERAIAERTCSTLRYGLEFFGAHAIPAVLSLLERLSACYESTGFASFVWIIGKTTRFFGDEEAPELRTAFARAFERVSQQTFGLLKIQRPEDVPDSAFEFFEAQVLMCVS